MDDNLAWLTSNQHVTPEATSVETQAFDRGSSLEAKAAGILGGLAVLTAVITGVAIAIWDSTGAWQRAFLLTSAAYSLLSLTAALLALQPRRVYVVTADAIRETAEAVDSEVAFRVQVAAQRFTTAQANRNRLIRLSNLISVAGVGARNALIFGTVPLIAFSVQHVH